MSNTSQQLLEKALGGDTSAFDELFGLHRDRLRRAVRVRLHPMVRARIDESDIIQEAYLKALKGLGTYKPRKDQPFFLWLRFIARQQVLETHRTHLDVQMRSLHREASFDLDGAISEVMAARLRPAGERSPLSELARQEVTQKIREILAVELSESDREILLMRHFEMLTNEEIAHELDISRTNVSTRYIRALTRLRKLIQERLGSSID